MENKYFKNDIYETPSNKKRHLWDRLFFNSRLYFLINYAYLALKNRAIANKGKFDRETWIDSSHDVFNVVENCGGKIHLSGLENIFNCKEPVVFASNHMSTLETMIFPCMIVPTMNMTFVVKKSLVDHPFLGPVLRSKNPVVVGRENSREDLKIVLTDGVEKLKNGTSIILFPQGTRKPSFDPKDFNTLAVKLAKKANVKVIPVAIKTDFWKDGKGIFKDVGPINRNNTVYFKFGKAIEVLGNGKEENEEIVNFISESLNNWDSNIVVKQ